MEGKLNMKRSTTRAALTLLALVSAAALPACGGATPSGENQETVPPAPASPPDRQPGESALRINIDGCQECVMQLNSAPDGDLEWSSEPFGVETGEQWVLVPTRHTRGLSLNITSPAVPDKPSVAVALYEGLQPGDQVNEGSVKSYAEAYGCWAGVEQDGVFSVTISTKVVETEDGYALLAYTPVGVEPHGKPAETKSGVLQAEDFFRCN